MTTLDDFSRWFRLEAKRLLHLELQVAVAEIEGVLRRLDSHLGVELSDGDDGREMIVTARSNRDAMAVADAVVSSISKEDGWVIQALKPAMGFEFQIEVGRIVLRASSLHFEPMSSAKRPGELGIRVFVPGELAKHASILETIWLVLETGVGERAASSIAHLSVKGESEAPAGALGIEDLGAYIDWHFSKGKGT